MQRGDAGWECYGTEIGTNALTRPARGVHGGRSARSEELPTRPFDIVCSIEAYRTPAHATGRAEERVQVLQAWGCST